MTSIRRRLLLGAAAATIAIFAAAAVSLYLVSRHFLIAEFDRGLRTKVQAIVSMTEFDLAGMRIDAEDALKIPEFQPGPKAEYFEISSSDGHVVRSPSLEDRQIDRSHFSPQGTTAAAFIVLPDGRPGRALLKRAKTQPDENLRDAEGPEITIVVARAPTELMAMLSRLRLLLMIVCGAATVALVALTSWIIRRGLRPLDDVARGIAAIGAADLGARVGTRGVPDELVPVVSRLNDLLERLQAAFDREKCFTADAAHELRTPLSAVAAALEVCGREHRDAQTYQRVVGDCLKVVRQMHGMIDNLLLLARTDAGSVPVVSAPIDVGQLVRDCWSRFEAVAELRRLHVELELEDQLICQTDEEKLEIILNNLLDNAVHYADESGRLRIAAGNSNQTVKISVANTGSRLAPADAERVFDRFWRGDSSRSSTGRHCGLGLSVCRRLATALGATVSAQCAPDGLFVVKLELRNGFSTLTGPAPKLIV